MMFVRPSSIVAKWRQRGALIAVALLGAVCASTPIAAAEIWGGSLALTSDYFVRGISRSDHEVAVQSDLHVATDTGLIGGVFASSVQFDAGDSRSAELSGFVGFAWQVSDAWRAKALTSYYGYVWNHSGSQYNYAELEFEAAYDDWLDLDAVYSPDTPRYVYERGLMGVRASSVEATARTPWRHRLAASAGVGYSQLAGPGGGGYAYWSVGGTLDLAPVTLSAAYVSTSAEAAALYDGESAHNSWIASVIWRF